METSTRVETGKRDSHPLTIAQPNRKKDYTFSSPGKGLNQ